jgi:Tfp pilus assembly protein PilO
MSKNSKSLLLPGVILVLLILVSLFWLKPKVVAVIKIRRDLITGQKSLAELTKKLATLEGLSKTELTEKVNLALKILPAEKDIPRNLFVIKELVLNSGLSGTGLSIPEVGEIASESATAIKSSKDEILPSLEMKLDLVGPREKIGDFLQQIESTAPLMRVSSLTIAQKEGDLSEAMIGIKSYFLPFPKTLGKLEQSLPPITPQEEKVFNGLSNFKLLEWPEVSTTSALPTHKSDLFTY